MIRIGRESGRGRRRRQTEVESQGRCRGEDEQVGEVKVRWGREGGMEERTERRRKSWMERCRSKGKSDRDNGMDKEVLGLVGVWGG